MEAQNGQPDPAKDAAEQFSLGLTELVNKAMMQGVHPALVIFNLEYSKAHVMAQVMPQPMAVPEASKIIPIRRLPRG